MFAGSEHGTKQQTQVKQDVNATNGLFQTQQQLVCTISAKQHMSSNVRQPMPK